MSNHQEHFGRKFYLDHKTGYLISCNYSKENPRCRAHTWVWKHFHKIIPKGYHVHHINEDKSDNNIENLELIKASRHMSLHMQDPIRKQQAREAAEKIRPLTKAWHRSAEGHAWHQYHAEKQKFGKWEARKLECKQCKSEYETTKRSQSYFCSNKCKSAWRRKAGLDNIVKKCLICDKEFIIHKYKQTKTCGRACGTKLRKNSTKERSLSALTAIVTTETSFI